MNLKLKELISALNIFPKDDSVDISKRKFFKIAGAGLVSAIVLPVVGNIPAEILTSDYKITEDTGKVYPPSGLNFKQPVNFEYQLCEFEAEEGDFRFVRKTKCSYCFHKGAWRLFASSPTVIG